MNKIAKMIPFIATFSHAPKKEMRWKTVDCNFGIRSIMWKTFRCKSQGAFFTIDQMQFYISSKMLQTD